MPTQDEKPGLGNWPAPALVLCLTLLLLWGCAEVTRPRPPAPEVEALQLSASRRHPHQTWALERVSRVFLRLLAVVPQVHGRTYPFLGFNWWGTDTGKLVVDNVWRPSPAHDAGLKQGDLILAVNNWPVYPWVPEFDGYLKNLRGTILDSLPAELLISILLDLKHVGMETREQYFTGPVNLLVQREEQKFAVVLYPQHLPAEYGVLVASQIPVINAYAAPGKIIITRRYVNFCLTDAELALVLGHELAHQVLGHQVRRAGQWELGKLGGNVVAAFSSLSLGRLIHWRYYPRVEEGVGRVVEGAVFSAFSREDEREADAYGLWYAFQAGYEVDAGLAIWERLGGVINDPFERTHFLDSHPAPLERLAALKRLTQYFKAGRAAEVFLQLADLDRRPPPE